MDEGTVLPNGDVVVVTATPKVPAMPAGAAPAAPAQPAAPATPAAPAVAAPAAAAAVPAVPAAEALSLEAKPDPAEITGETVYEYTPTGDAAFDVALNYVGQRGVAPEHPAMVAAFKGDFSPLEAVLKNMGDKAKGYGTYLNAAKDAYARNADKGNATVALVHEACGGAEQWAQVQAWAAKNAEPAEKAYINHAFQLGGSVAAKVAKELATAYAAANPKGGAAALKEGAGGAAASAAVSPLSPAEYQKAVAELIAKKGLVATKSSEYAELTARRKAFR